MAISGSILAIFVFGYLAFSLMFLLMYHKAKESDDLIFFATVVNYTIFLFLATMALFSERFDLLYNEQYLFSLIAVIAALPFILWYPGFFAAKLAQNLPLFLQNPLRSAAPFLFIAFCVFMAAFWLYYYRLTGRFIFVPCLLLIIGYIGYSTIHRRELHRRKWDDK